MYLYYFDSFFLFSFFFYIIQTRMYILIFKLCFFLVSFTLFLLLITFSNLFSLAGNGWLWSHVPHLFYFVLFYFIEALRTIIFMYLCVYISNRPTFFFVYQVRRAIHYNKGLSYLYFCPFINLNL